jgi:hypothetical protein
VVRVHGRFVAAFLVYQIVERSKQIEVPKYFRPHRHAEADHRSRRLLHGDLLVRGAGGYQMLGITPAPIYDPRRSSPTQDFGRVWSRRHREIQAHYLRE